jgi:hypothetical protein
VRVSLPVASRSSRTLEWEVLPPEEKAGRSQLELLFRWLALIMDNLLRLPGTRFRFGLDPIIGLFPGVGDSASAIISALALIHAARCGLPRVALARMSLSILINEIVGIVPGIGDAFSFWFKSNARNYQILQAYMATPTRPRRSDWVFVILVLAILFLIALVGLLVSFFVLSEFVRFLTGR